MYKQIIIARKDLNMSPGKLAAQISHASMAFLTNMIRNNVTKVPINCHPVYTYKNNVKEEINYPHEDYKRMAKEAIKNGEDFFYCEPVDPLKPYGEQKPTDKRYEYRADMHIDGKLYDEWINGSFTKCVLQAKNKNKLLKAVELAEELGMKENEDFFLIKDNCYTELDPEEFDENGQGRTLTCIGFKPMDAEIIDKIGKKFQLYK